MCKLCPVFRLLPSFRSESTLLLGRAVGRGQGCGIRFQLGIMWGLVETGDLELREELGEGR